MISTPKAKTFTADIANLLFVALGESPSWRTLPRRQSAVSIERSGSGELPTDPGGLCHSCGCGGRIVLFGWCLLREARGVPSTVFPIRETSPRSLTGFLPVIWQAFGAIQDRVVPKIIRDPRPARSSGLGRLLQRSRGKNNRPARRTPGPLDGCVGRGPVATIRLDRAVRSGVAGVVDPPGSAHRPRSSRRGDS